MNNNTNGQRHGFTDIRRTLRAMREEAGNASWFTIRHSEICMLLWDMRSDQGLEVQYIPSLSGLDQSTVNRILHTLGDNHRNRNGLGWIEVRYDEHDRRYRRVFITDKGMHVFMKLLNAGSQTHAETDTISESEQYMLAANNLTTMKAEVGQVKIKINNNTVNAEVVRGIDADKALRLETEGKVVRRMNEKQGRWWLYDVDDRDFSKPLYSQKDTPKRSINLMAEGLIEITTNADSQELGKKVWDLEEQLKVAMQTLNTDEYYRLRNMVMRGIAKAAERKQIDAEMKHDLAERERQKAAGLMNRVGHQPGVNIEEKNQMYAEAKESMDKWAKMEKSSDEDFRQKDMMSKLMMAVENLSAEVASLKKERDGD